MKKAFFFPIFGFIFAASTIFAPAADAFTFDKNTLITDYEMTDSSYLSLSGIQAFLAEKGSGLANYYTTGIAGTGKRSVAEIIRNVSRKYSLNPMLFLVMAQKESSAVTNSKVTYSMEHWLLGYGRCDSCSEADAARYRGIANQLHSAADRIRNGYLADLQSRGYTISGWGPGITKTTMDGIAVTPSNNATAALYTYNPCVGAYGGGYPQFGCNSAFQKLWQDWNPRYIPYYPNGSLLAVNGTVYLIQNNEKRPFTSMSALMANHDPSKIIAVPIVVGEQYPTANPIFFPNYALVQNPSGTVYLLVDGYKRGITSYEAFRSIGFNPEEIIPAGWKELNAIPDGPLITTASKYPQGALLQNRDTGAVVYVGPKGYRHDIWSREIMDTNFSGRPILASSSSEIASFKDGKPLKLKDGTLVTSPNSPAVYVISNGRKRPFISGSAFKKLGYKWEHVIHLSDHVLALHPTGKYMKLKTKKNAGKSASSSLKKKSTAAVEPEERRAVEETSNTPPAKAPVTAVAVEKKKKRAPVPATSQAPDATSPSNALPVDDSVVHHEESDEESNHAKAPEPTLNKEVLNSEDELTTTNQSPIH